LPAARAGESGITSAELASRKGGRIGHHVG
jgi:hypothetical protein